MNMFQKRHAVLAAYIGKRITTGQLKEEVPRRFPGTNPSSVNAADCFSTSGKAAGCTCPECTKLGGFAVNGYGIVDMGASGWGGVALVYTPTGRHRATGAASDAVHSRGSTRSAGGALRIDPNDAAECVQRYNAGSYRGCGNVALDEEAYRRFSKGLSRNFAELVDQLEFVGERYGAAQERFGSIRKEADLIASKLYPILERWLRLVMEARWMIRCRTRRP
jgi:hypothetical protein